MYVLSMDLQKSSRMVCPFYIHIKLSLSLSFNILYFMKTFLYNVCSFIKLIWNFLLDDILLLPVTLDTFSKAYSLTALMYGIAEPVYPSHV